MLNTALTELVNILDSVGNLAPTLSELFDAIFDLLGYVDSFFIYISKFTYFVPKAHLLIILSIAFLSVTTRLTIAVINLFKPILSGLLQGAAVAAA